MARRVASKPPALLADLDAVAAFAEQADDELGGIDLLVNNAGVTWGAPIGAFPEKGWDKVMDTNVKSLFFLTQTLLPNLRAGATADDPARIINIGSEVFDRGVPNFSPYVAAKGAQRGWTRSMRWPRSPSPCIHSWGSGSRSITGAVEARMGVAQSRALTLSHVSRRKARATSAAP